MDTITFNDTEHGDQFFCVWDNMCWCCLMSAVCSFNDYTRTLIDLVTDDDFVNTAACVFTLLLFSLQGVTGH